MKTLPSLHSSAFEPTLPAGKKGVLTDLTSELLRKAGSLATQIGSPIVRARVARLVREMNSYYSNLIEGHKTLPRDIEKALAADFSGDPEQRANQELNRAHIEVEESMRNRLEKEPELSIHEAGFIQWLHGEFYRRLPDALQWSRSESGKKYKIEPGELRTFEVAVGEHQPPHHSALPKMLARFAEAYGSREILATDRLIALAAAHHRLAWIHPFGDGNGRVIRLYSHACIARAKVDGLGLWTLSRGLARKRSEYFAAMRAADRPRWNDLDGRGNLSDRGLADFCEFFLRTMLDQIEFMDGLFQFQTLSRRMERYLELEALEVAGRDRERLARLLKAALVEGEVERGRVGEIVGLQDTSARELTRRAVAEGLLESSTPKGPLMLAFTAKTLESYFPKLYLDLPAN